MRLSPQLAGSDAAKAAATFSLMKHLFALIALLAVVGVAPASLAQSPPAALTVANNPLRLAVGFFKTDITPDRSAGMFGYWPTQEAMKEGGYEPSATPKGFRAGGGEKLNQPRNNNLDAYEMQFRAVAGRDCQAVYPAVRPPGAAGIPGGFSQLVAAGDAARESVCRTHLHRWKKLETLCRAGLGPGRVRQGWAGAHLASPEGFGHGVLSRLHRRHEAGKVTRARL